DIEERYPDIAVWDGRVGIYEGLPEMLDEFIESMYEKGFWRAGRKKIVSALDRNRKNSLKEKQPKEED
ncbi:MAG: hypothetical protein ACE5KV_07090, partial [Thermoplasmata archaeon]